MHSHSHKHHYRDSDVFTLYARTLFLQLQHKFKQDFGMVFFVCVYFVYATQRIWNSTGAIFYKTYTE